MKSTLVELAVKAALLAGEKIMEIYNDPSSDFEIERKSDNSPLTKADKVSHKVISEILSSTEIPILSEEGAAIPYEERKEWNKLWVVDPIDGTKEFIKKNGEFTVNIALIEDGAPILGVIYVPALRELYYAANDEGAFKAENITSFNQVEKNAKPLPLESERPIYTCVVVASRSHLSAETSEFIENLKNSFSQIDIISKGSSLKICLVAEGSADIYPRYAPTMEWDTAAGDALLRAMGRSLVDAYSGKKLKYNKQNLLNPYFIAR